MNNKITILSDTFINEENNKEVEGITIIIDGILEQFLEIIRAKNANYKNNSEIIRDALIDGLDTIRKNS